MQIGRRKKTADAKSLLPVTPRESPFNKGELTGRKKS